jgi:hypothetical protein
MALQLDRATLEAALVGYQRQLDEIQTKMSELRRRLGGRAAASVADSSAAAPRAKGARRGRKHRMSAEGRARIAAAQRARWAKFKKKGE